jgi:hypothetical protein
MVWAEEPEPLEDPDELEEVEEEVDEPEELVDPDELDELLELDEPEELVWPPELDELDDPDCVVPELEVELEVDDEEAPLPFDERVLVDVPPELEVDELEVEEVAAIVEPELVLDVDEPLDAAAPELVLEFATTGLLADDASPATSAALSSPQPASNSRIVGRVPASRIVLRCIVAIL